MPSGLIGTDRTDGTDGTDGTDTEFPIPRCPRSADSHTLHHPSARSANLHITCQWARLRRLLSLVMSLLDCFCFSAIDLADAVSETESLGVWLTLIPNISHEHRLLIWHSSNHGIILLSLDIYIIIYGRLTKRYHKPSFRTFTTLYGDGKTCTDSRDGLELPQTLLGVFQSHLRLRRHLHDSRDQYHCIGPLGPFNFMASTTSHSLICFESVTVVRWTGFTTPGPVVTGCRSPLLGWTLAGGGLAEDDFLT